MTSVENVVSDLSEEGRGGDSLVGHLSPGDLIIPREIHTPEMVEALRQHFSKHGTSVERYTAGHKENSKNPKTGMPEFGFFSNPFKSVKNIFTHPLKAVEHIAEAALPVAGAVIGGSIGGPFGAAAGAELGGTGSGLLKGESIGQAAEGAVPGAVTSGVLGSTDVGSLFGLDTSLGTAAGNAVSGLLPDSVNSAISSLTPDFSGALSSLGLGGDAATSVADGAAPITGVTSSDLAPLSVAGQTAAGEASALSDGSATSWFDSYDPNSLLTAGGGGANVGTQGVANAGTANFDLNGNIGGGTAPSLASVANVAASEPAKSFGSKLLSSVTSPGALIAGGGLALDALKQGGIVGNNTPKGQNQITQEASNLAGQGAQLSQYLQNGTLPPGLQQGINQAAEAAKATIRSKYASMGSSGSSAEMQELAAIDSRAQDEGAQMAMQLLQTGISETGMASQLYQALMNNSLQQDKELGSAIASFASAAGGGNTAGGTTINVGGAHA